MIPRMSVVVFAVTTTLLFASQPPAHPAVDHHQHLFSPEISKLAGLRTLSAVDLVGLLDLAGIRRAIVFSLGYQYGNPNRAPIENEYERVKAENDWTSRQIAAFQTACADSAGSIRSKTTHSPRSRAVARIRPCASG
jgi:hypothetical protein